jgi:hypothetical protein
MASCCPSLGWSLGDFLDVIVRHDQGNGAKHHLRECPARFSTKCRLFMTHAQKITIVHCSQCYISDSLAICVARKLRPMTYLKNNYIKGLQQEKEILSKARLAIEYFHREF